MNKAIKKIIVFDGRDYIPEKGNTGGHYGYTYTYTRIGSNRFQVKYGCTSDFAFCPVCGDFHQYDEDACGDYQIMPETEVDEDMYYTTLSDEISVGIKPTSKENAKELVDAGVWKQWEYDDYMQFGGSISDWVTYDVEQGR